MLDLATLDQKLLVASPAKEGKNIISPICRLSFPNLFVAKAAGKNPKPDAEKKYSVALLIPPQADITLLKKAAQEAAEGEWGNKAREMKLHNPFKKAEDEKREGYLPGWTVIRASSKTKPQVREIENGILLKITEDDPEVVYPGRWARVSLNAFAFKQDVKNGVTFGLNNVMLLNHDDSLGGRMKAEDEFEVPDGVSGSSDADASSIF